MVSDAMEYKLTFWQRVCLWLHLLMCRYCYRFRKQLLLLREACRSAGYTAEDLSSATLPPDVRERIRQCLQAKQL